MIGLIAAAAVKAITSYLVTSYMKAHYGSVDIEGAPSWYGTESKDEICVSTFKRGDVGDVDIVKKTAKVKLQNKLSNIVSMAIHTNKRFKNLKPDEEEFLETIIKDKKLKWFVDSKGYYKNVEAHEGKIFVKMCVSKEDFISYEQVRIKELSKEITLYKTEKAFDDLEGKGKKYNDTESKAFDELDNSNF